MHIINHNPEFNLINLANNLSNDKRLWQVVYLRISHLPNNKKNEAVTKKLINIISEIIDLGDETKIVICTDNDIFLFITDLSNNTYNVLLNEVAVFLLDTPIIEKEQINELFKLYDINKESVEFFELCKKKFEDAENHTKISQSKLYDNQQMQGIIDINYQMLHSSIEKRSKRERKLILLIEDEAFSRKLVTLNLPGKFDVISVSHGKEALEEYARNAPDVTFLDLNLPDIDGHQVLREIIKVDKDAYVVIISSNNSKTEIMDLITKEGAKGYIIKPFTTQKLIDYIEKSPFISGKK